MIEKIKRFFKKNWIYIAAAFATLVPLLLWILSGRKGNKPETRWPSKEEVDALLEKRKLVEDRNKQEDSIDKKKEEIIYEIKKKQAEQNKKTDDLRGKSEADVGRELDRLL